MYKICVRNKFETLRDDAGENWVEGDYESLRLAIEEANTEILRKMNKEPKRLG